MNTDGIVIDADEDLAPFISRSGIDATAIRQRAMTGDTLTYGYIILAVTSLVVPKLINLLTELVKARKNVKVSFKGMVVQGVSEKNLPEVLKRLSEHFGSAKAR
jgi:hypothetical protein